MSQNPPPPYVGEPPSPPLGNGVTTYVELGWTFMHLGGNRYKISQSGVTMTGANVSTHLRIPFPHRIVRIHLYHTDSSHAASTDALNVIMRRESAAVKPAYFEDDLWNESGITDSKIIQVYGEKYEFEEGTWTLILNSTNTDLVIPVIYVQQLQRS